MTHPHCSETTRTALTRTTPYSGVSRSSPYFLVVVVVVEGRVQKVTMGLAFYILFRNFANSVPPPPHETFQRPPHATFLPSSCNFFF